ncbi:MAG: hypothetical protein KatS3mg035_0038 [Bacteroidia bacterium]|nr:MAG: hypothetical protein KatS3mg035_0038 [Bacteroidia bacterium]
MKIQQEVIQAIRKGFAELKTKEDLVELLNFANLLLYGNSYKPFHLKSLTYYANPELCPERYQSFSIPKKSGGARIIHAPVKGLKSILRALNLVLQCMYEPHEAAKGFVLNQSIVDNAKKHIRHNYVFNLDLKDFFHSFDRNRVKMALMKEPFHLHGDKEALAFLLASLCTHPIEIEGEIRNVLPQGSPTSPTLTNILCQKLDHRLTGLAKRFKATYTRYADDITFSSQHNIYNKDDEFFKELKRIIEEYHLYKFPDKTIILGPPLQIHEKKIRLQKEIYRQEVTGLIVNEKVNVRRRYVKQIRMWLYYWEKYGYEKAEQIFQKYYIADKGHIKKSNARLENVLAGKLQFLRMVKGNQDGTYKALMKRFAKLTGIPAQANQQNQQNPYQKYRLVNPNSIQNGVKTKTIGNNVSNYIGVPVVLTSQKVFKSQKGAQSPSYNPSRVILPSNARFENGIIIVKNWTDIKYPDNPDLEGYLKELPDVLDPNNFGFTNDMGVDIIGYRNFTLMTVSLLPYEIANGLIMTEAHYNYIIKQPHWKNSLTDTNEIAIMNNAPVSTQPLQPVQPITKQTTSVSQKTPNTNSKLNLLEENEKGLLDVNKLRKKFQEDGWVLVFQTSKTNLDKINKSQEEVSYPIIHNALRTVQILNYFTQNDKNLKFTTHSWEQGRYKSYDDFIKKIKQEWNSFSNELKELSKRLHGKIGTFLFDSRLGEKKNNKYLYAWGEQALCFGWSSPELKSFMQKNPDKDPFNCPIPEHIQKIGNNKDFFYFKDYAIAFKNEIEFREDSNKLKKIFEELWEDVLSYDFELIGLEKMEGFSFFTDVHWVKNAIKKIFEMFANEKYRTFSQISLERYSNFSEQPNYHLIRITQKGSFIKRQPDDPKLKTPSGDLGTIIKLLENLCDYSILSKFNDGKCYRINYLSLCAKTQIEELSCDKNIDGFTHELKFYL